MSCGCVVQNDILYKLNSDTPALHTLDLYIPEKVGPAPSLLVCICILCIPFLFDNIDIHGGLWMDRDKRDYSNIGTLFAKNGYAVAVINYRLSKTEG